MNDRAVVGVVGPDADAEDVRAAVEAAGGVAESTTAASVDDDSDYLIAVGESALLSVARARPVVPVLPVAAGRGVRSVPRNRVEGAVEGLLGGEWTSDAHRRLEVTAGERTRATALMDVMLVTTEPAEISEYAVESDGERVSRFRADGVVVATPAGSPGYARAADGPVLAPGISAVSVVPVAPFAKNVDHWVVDHDGLTCTVERDEAAVQLLADDRVVGTVDADETVSLTPGAPVTVAVVAESRSCFGRD